MDGGAGDIQGIETFFQQCLDHVIVMAEIPGLKCLTETLEELIAACVFDFARAGDIAAADPLASEAFDVSDQEHLSAAGEGNADSAASGASRAPDAVHVIFRVVGEIEIEHHLDVVDIDAAGRHIGGHQEAESARAELAHDAVAGCLGHAAVDAVGRVARAHELLGQFIHHSLGVGENDGQCHVVQVDEPGEGLELPTAIHFEINLLDGRHGEGLGLDADPDRLAGVAGDEFFDRTRYGGREHHGLALRRGGREDLLDVVAEAHVEHLVGFIEDDGLDAAQLQRLAVDVVDDAARGADDDVGAGAQSGELALVALSAVDGQGFHSALEERQLVDFFADLDGQFAGGAEDQHLGTGRLGVHPFDGRDGEGRGLPGTRLGLSDDILARHQHRDGLGLDGGGLFESQALHGLEDFFGQTEFRKQLRTHSQEQSLADSVSSPRSFSHGLHNGQRIIKGSVYHKFDGCLAEAGVRAGSLEGSAGSVLRSLRKLWGG